MNFTEAWMSYDTSSIAEVSYRMSASRSIFRARAENSLLFPCSAFYKSNTASVNQQVPDALLPK